MTRFSRFTTVFAAFLAAFCFSISTPEVAEAGALYNISASSNSNRFRNNSRRSLQTGGGWYGSGGRGGSSFGSGSGRTSGRTIGSRGTRRVATRMGVASVHSGIRGSNYYPAGMSYQDQVAEYHRQLALWKKMKYGSKAEREALLLELNAGRNLRGMNSVRRPRQHVGKPRRSLGQIARNEEVLEEESEEALRPSDSNESDKITTEKEQGKDAELKIAKKAKPKKKPGLIAKLKKAFMGS